MEFEFNISDGKLSKDEIIIARSIQQTLDELNGITSRSNNPIYDPDAFTLWIRGKYKDGKYDSIVLSVNEFPELSSYPSFSFEKKSSTDMKNKFERILSTNVPDRFTIKRDIGNVFFFMSN